MHHAIRAGHDLDKGAEIRGAHDFACVDLADLRRFGQRFDAFPRHLGRRAVVRSDEHRAVVGNVDLGSGFFLDGTNGLAAWANDCADLLHRHHHDRDARGMRLQLRARRGEYFKHLVQDVLASGFRLLQCFSHHLRSESGDLDVHLQCSDAFVGAGHFEIHIPQVVFDALDVAEDLVVAAIGDQAHGDAGNGRLDWHTRIHQRQCGTTN